MTKAEIEERLEAVAKNVSLDYTGMNQEEIDQMDEALTLAFNAMSILNKSQKRSEEGRR